MHLPQLLQGLLETAHNKEITVFRLTQLITDALVIDRRIKDEYHDRPEPAPPVSMENILTAERSQS